MGNEPHVLSRCCQSSCSALCCLLKSVTSTGQSFFEKKKKEKERNALDVKLSLPCLTSRNFCFFYLLCRLFFFHPKLLSSILNWEQHLLHLWVWNLDSFPVESLPSAADLKTICLLGFEVILSSQKIRTKLLRCHALIGFWLENHWLDYVEKADSNLKRCVVLGVYFKRFCRSLVFKRCWVFPFYNKLF